jgi:hypothetical protein
MPRIAEPNADLYPIAHAVASTINDNLNRVDPPADMTGLTLLELADRLVEIIGEYEHGVANVCDVGSDGDIRLDQYADVATDIYLYLRGVISTSTED